MTRDALDLTPSRHEHSDQEISPTQKLALDYLLHHVDSGQHRRDVVRSLVRKTKLTKVAAVESAIKRRLKEDPDDVKAHRANHFTVMTEACFAACLITLDKKGAPVTNAVMLRILRVAFPEWAEKLTEEWAKGFRVRWSHWLKKRRSAVMAPERLCTLTHETLERFIASFAKIGRLIAPDGSNLVNVDEVPCTYVGGSNSTVWSALGRPKHGEMKSKYDDVRTFIPFTCADGRLLMVVVVFRRSKSTLSRSICVPAEEASAYMPSLPVFYAVTENGFVTTELWRSIMEEFVKLRPIFFGINNVVLLLDNLSAHVNVENVRFCTRNHIYVWYIPPHTSHFLQPNDNGPNAAAKAKAHSLKSQQVLACALRGITPSFIVSSILLQAITCSITSSVIIGAWRRTGMWPWDPDLVRELAEPYIAKPAKKSKIPPPTLQTDPTSTILRIVEAAINTYAVVPTKKVNVTSRASKLHHYKDVLDEAARKTKLDSEKRRAKEAKAAEKKEREEARELIRKMNAERKTQLEKIRAKHYKRPAPPSAPPLRTHCSSCNAFKPRFGTWYSCSTTHHDLLCGPCARSRRLSPREPAKCSKCEEGMIRA